MREAGAKVVRLVGSTVPERLHFWWGEARERPMVKGEKTWVPPFSEGVAFPVVARANVND
jgi:hypothetical protein